MVLPFDSTPTPTAASVAHQSVGVSSEDLEHKEAFDAICSKYNEKDDEDDDEVGE